MTNEPSLEQPSPGPQETTATPEVVDANSLLEKFGFIETEEMTRLKRGMIEASAADDIERFRTLMTQYGTLSQQLTEEMDINDYRVAQIGRIVAMGLIRRDAGRIESYLYDLDDALVDARYMGYHHDVARLIAEMIDNALETYYGVTERPSRSSEIAAILHGWKFDDETCAEVSGMPFEEAFETAHRYLTQAGKNADQILAQFIEGNS